MITVFGTEWFKKYNKWIVKLAKLPFIGEWVFCFKKYGHYFDIDNLLEVQPNAVVEDMKLMWTKCVKVKGQWVAYDCTNKLHNRLIKKECKEKLLPTRRNHYFVRNEYALRLQSVFYPIWITFHIWDIITRPFPQLNLGFDTLTVYPDAGTGNTTVDGFVRHAANGQSFATVRGADGNFHSDTDNYISSLIVGDSATNCINFINRIILTFATGTIPSDATITEAISSEYVTGKNNDMGDDVCHTVQAYPAANNALADSDYKNGFGTTSFGYFSYADVTVNSYANCSLNASGITTITKGSGGITKLGKRGGWDFNNSFGGTWSAFYSSGYSFRSSDYGSNKPKLVITYTLPVVTPTVTTQSATNIATTSCTGNGNITDTGGENNDKRGFVYGNTSKSAPGNVAPGSSGYDAYAEDSAGGYGTGAFTKAISSLTAGTKYYMRAYSHNSVGYAYGSEIEFTTLNAYIRALSDSVSTAASRSVALSRLGAFSRSSADSLMNSVNRLVTVTKGSISDLSDSVMSAASRFTAVARFSENIRGISSSILIGASRLVSLSRFSEGVRSLSDTLAISTSLSRVFNAIRGLSDTLSITVILSRVSESLRSLTDSVLAGASRVGNLSHATIHIKALADSILAGASRNVTLSRFVAHGRSFVVDMLAGADRLTVLTAKFRVQWFNQAKHAAITPTNQTKHNATITNQDKTLSDL
jgi:hypothetical protein